MPLIRATFFFRDNNDYGWTETLYNQGDTLPEVKNRAQALKAFRIPLLGESATMMGLRVSDDLIKRDSLLDDAPFRVGNSVLEKAGDNDIANTALNVRLEAGTLNRRVLYLRGIADEIVKEGGRYVPTAQFNGRFAAWVLALSGDGWSIKTRTDNPTPPNITTIAQDPGTGAVTFTTDANHGLTRNKAVVIKGIKGPSFLNGINRVFEVPTLTTFVVLSNRFLGFWFGTGTAQTLVYALRPSTGGRVMRATHRIAGRPSVPRRGRRKATPRS